jgi:hypothetical protein
MQERRELEALASELHMRAVLRMQHIALAAAFAGWGHAVACSGAARQLLRRVLLGALHRAFVAWR